jgi:tetratricopeptide (TPR) repeat protein
MLAVPAPLAADVPWSTLSTLVVVAVVLIGLVALWLTYSKWPGRYRARRKIQDALQRKAWAEALEAVKELDALGPLPPAWEGRARFGEGEAYRLAAEEALAGGNYEEALRRYRDSARIRGLDDPTARAPVIDAMLAEVRRMTGAGTTHEAVEGRAFITRLLALDPSCSEALFWQGISFARTGQFDDAADTLRTVLAAEAKDRQSLTAAAPSLTSSQGSTAVSGKGCVDPPLYLGALLTRAGKPQEALRYLADANRIEANTPLVGWQLGQAIVASGGDAGLAVRALQKALGIKGLPRWLRTPENFWAEVFPEPARSYVARLTTKHRFQCPVFGGDVGLMVRQGMIALGQAQYRQGNFKEAANILNGVLKEAPPTLPVVRTLGLALTRLGSFDEGFKHLRTAFEQEDPKDPITAGYMAVCGARGKPSKPEDKAGNIAWAVRLLSRYAMPGNTEYAGLIGSVFGDTEGVPPLVDAQELERCCDVLTSVEATDAGAAAAYASFAAARTETLRPEVAWLYCRAAEQHGNREPAGLDLFAVTFRDLPPAREYFEKRKWDFADLEFAYLSRWADTHPGSYPSPPGAAHVGPFRKLLHDRSQHQEQSGKLEAALATIAVWHALEPRSAAAADRLASLYFRQDKPLDAARVLAEWQGQHPSDHRPWVRLALLHQHRGDHAACVVALERALSRAVGPDRADTAFLGARLALAEARGTDKTLVPGLMAMGPVRAEIIRFLEVCLQEKPDHAEALAMLAAVRWVIGDRSALAAQAEAMERAEAPNARFHYLKAVSQLAAGDEPRALSSASKAMATDGFLRIEASYLAGWLQLRHGQLDVELNSAATGLRRAAEANDSPSTEYARAHLGRLAFARNAFGEAIQWWQGIDAARRTQWGFDEVFRTATFLAALEGIGAGRFEQAAEQLRQAGKLGYRDRRLGSLLCLSLFKAGQQFLFGPAPDPRANGVAIAERAVRATTLLNQAIQAGFKDPSGSYLLGVAYKRQGKFGDARTAFRKLTGPDGNVALQRGLLSLREKQWAQAEPDLAEAWRLEPTCYAAGYDLIMTRLTLGKAAEAVDLLPAVAALAPTEEERHTLSALGRLLGTDHRAARADEPVAALPPAEESRLLDLVRGIGQVETAVQVLQAWQSRSASPAVRQARFEAGLLAARVLFDRCEWSGAEKALNSLPRHDDAAAEEPALRNLLGCCAALNQDFDGAATHFNAALRSVPTDLNIHQNLALAHEWQGKLTEAGPFWNRYFDLVERRRTWDPARADEWSRLAHDGLLRLSQRHAEKQQWPQALAYVERAAPLMPENVDTLERMFHLYNHNRQTDRARTTLRRMQQLRPNDPNFELYELDLIEIRETGDLERWVGELIRIRNLHPHNSRVEERVGTMIGNLLPLLSKIGDQLSNQLHKVARQVRELPNYQINWTAVHEVMRDLRRDFQRLRRIGGDCMNLVSNAEQRRLLREFLEYLDRKIDYCRRWQGE